MSDGRPAANDEDRLPWLEPYREPPARRAKPAKAKPKKARSGRGGLLTLAGVVGLSAALAGGYWLGQRDVAPASDTTKVAQSDGPDVVTFPVASAPSTTGAPEQVADANGSAGTVAAAPQQARRPAGAKRKVARRPKIHSAGVETANIEKVREDQGDPTPKPVWPKLPSPGPAGQVVQLGAFSNPDRAYVTYRMRIARYPALGRMPRVIVPVATGSNGRLLYVLRLGTTSRMQSQQVCRNLRRSGDHCLVIG